MRKINDIIEPPIQSIEIMSILPYLDLSVLNIWYPGTIMETFLKND